MTAPIEAAHGADAGLPHGYTLTDLESFAQSAVRLSTTVVLDRAEALDIAYTAIVAELYTADTRPHPGRLVLFGRYALYQAVNEQRRYAGVPKRDPSAGPGAAHSYARYWLAQRATPSHEPAVVDRTALAQIWPQLRPIDRQALLALAAHGDRKTAADALGLGYTTYCQRLATARQRFLAVWHEGETPSRPWRQERALHHPGGPVRTYAPERGRGGLTP